MSEAHVCLQELNAFASQRLDVELDDNQSQPAFRNAFTARQPSDAGARLQTPDQSFAPLPHVVSDTPILSQTSSGLSQNAPLPQQPPAPQQRSEFTRPSDVSSNGGDAVVVVDSRQTDGEDGALPQQGGLVKGLSDTPWLSGGNAQQEPVVSERSTFRQESFGASSFENGDGFAQQQGPQLQGRAGLQQPLQSDRAFAEPVSASRDSAFASPSGTPFDASANRGFEPQSEQQQVPQTAFATSAGRAFSVESQGTAPTAAPVPTVAHQVSPPSAPKILVLLCNCGQHSTFANLCLSSCLSSTYSCYALFGEQTTRICNPSYSHLIVVHQHC